MLVYIAWNIPKRRYRDAILVMSRTEEPPKRLSASRRALFPMQQDDDSDLGHMSPLSSNNSDTESTSDDNYFKSLKNNSADDYDILESIFKINDDVDDTPMRSTVVSFEHLTALDSENVIIPDTPVKESPMLKLETPHDTLIQSAGLPKLARKVPVEENESPEHKQQKFEHNNSKAKVRTALFPENETCVPVKSFYAKTENLSFTNKSFVNIEEVKLKKKQSAVYLCSRKLKKNRYGQINTGVKHKIKKPKQKKPTRKQVLKAAINLIENSPLNAYFDELKQLQNKSKVIQPIVEKPREGVVENRKFLKSHPDIQVAKRGHDFAFIKVPNRDVTEKLFDIDEEDKLVDKNCISNLINLLEDDKENDAVPPAKRAKLELLSPISQMCDTTSGLALNSPKKARNLTSVLESMTTSVQNSVSTDMEKAKMFPIFQMKPLNKAKREEKPVKSNQVKKWKSLPADQMLLDAGQKKFGLTQCAECEIIYHMGDPSEEIMHLNYHSAGNVLRFNVTIFIL